MGSHLNCIDKSMQFKWVPTTYGFMKKLDCVPIGICAVIRVNTVYSGFPFKTNVLGSWGKTILSEQF